ncbi:hypothetical protein J6590_044217 [Homalodisca vitripennis]|nr:hypothetical protein J6590_044217 [Homalodisca vitripennis]
MRDSLLFQQSPVYINVTEPEPNIVNRGFYLLLSRSSTSDILQDMLYKHADVVSSKSRRYTSSKQCSILVCEYLGYTNPFTRRNDRVEDRRADEDLEIAAAVQTVNQSGL